MAVHQRKFRWRCPDGNEYAAGGIVFYDEEGLWVVAEVSRMGLEYTDIGGKYVFEDCNVWEAIRRELYEETYGTIDVTTSTIRAASETSVKMMDGKGNPHYICIVAPTSILGTQLPDPDAFDVARMQVLKENPHVAITQYKQVKLVKLPFDKLRGGEDVVFSVRLKTMLPSILLRIRRALDEPRETISETPPCDEVEAP
jgi:hypothetical protein